MNKYKSLKWKRNSSKKKKMVEKIGENLVASDTHLIH